MRAREGLCLSESDVRFALPCRASGDITDAVSGQPPTRVRARVGAAPSPFVLLLFYFRLSHCGPSILTEIVAKELIFPMKNVIGF